MTFAPIQLGRLRALFVLRAVDGNERFSAGLRRILSGARVGDYHSDDARLGGDAGAADRSLSSNVAVTSMSVAAAAKVG